MRVVGALIAPLFFGNAIVYMGAMGKGVMGKGAMHCAPTWFNATAV